MLKTDLNGETRGKKIRKEPIIVDQVKVKGLSYEQAMYHDHCKLGLSQT